MQEQTLEIHTRMYSRESAEHVAKSDINLQIAGKTPRIKIRGQQTGNVKIHQRRHMQSQQIVVFIVIIVTKQDTQKTDFSRRKGK
jgi:hypothetical protein